MKKQNSEKKEKRTRNWVFVVYPESAPEDWIEILKQQQIEFVVSPLHDMDISDANTGELKKAHWHVLLCFSSVKSYEQVLEITKLVNGTIPQICNSFKGTVRYMVHRDDPNKAQYNVLDIQVYGDVDIVSPFKTSVSRYEAIKEMLAYIKANNIIEFQDLMDYAVTEQEEWFRYLCDNTAYVIQQYIKSCRHRNSDKQ